MTFRILWFILSFLITGTTFATHIRGGYIQVKRIAAGGNEYEITFIGYRDTDAGIKFGGGVFDLGDGTIIDGSGTEFDINETEITPIIVKAEISIRHTYTGIQSYTVSYQERGRNFGVTNMDNSVNTSFYVETTFSIDPFLGHNASTPTLLTNPVIDAAGGKAFYLHLEVEDEDQDLVKFLLATPKQSQSDAVFNYRLPDHARFYEEYATGDQNNGGFPFYIVDPIAGNLVWNAPSTSYSLSGKQCPEGIMNCSEYSVAMMIEEKREVNGEQFFLSSTLVDFQIIVNEDEDYPRLDLSELYYCQDDPRDFKIETSSPGDHKIEFQPNDFTFELNDLEVDSTGTLSGSNTLSIPVSAFEVEGNIRIKLVRGDQLVYSYMIPELESCEDLLTVLPENESIVIYPNPFDNKIIIEANVDRRKWRVRLYNLEGRTVLDQMLMKSQMTMPEDLPRGTYVLILQNGSAVMKKKLIKK